MSRALPAGYRHLMLGALALAACRVCPSRPATPARPDKPCPRDSDCVPEAPRIVEPILPIDERPTPFEVAAWVDGAGGIRREAEKTNAVASLGGGVEGTFRLGPEEELMRDRFKAEYDAYKALTKRLIPGIW